MSKKITRSRKTTTKKTTRKAAVRQLVTRPFADNTLSNSAFFSLIRSALREKSRWWYPIKVCRERARVIYVGNSRKRKWMYKCEMCGSIIVDAKATVVHHLVECGKLNSFEDLPTFTKNLFCDSNLLQLLCNQCHTKIHEDEKV